MDGILLFLQGVVTGVLLTILLAADIERGRHPPTPEDMPTKGESE